MQGSEGNTTASFSDTTINTNLSASQFLWNVCNGLDVTLSQFQLIGSLLAPMSGLTISSAGQVGVILFAKSVFQTSNSSTLLQEGITVVSTLTGQGFNKMLAPFEGFFCQA